MVIAGPQTFADVDRKCNGHFTMASGGRAGPGPGHSRPGKDGRTGCRVTTRYQRIFDSREFISA